MTELDKIQESIEALESRNAFQDDAIEQLNNELTVHQAEIAHLKEQLRLLATRIKNSGDTQSEINEVEPPPPHY